LHCGFFYLLLFSSPNFSGRRLDVYHTSTYGVALVRISNAGLKYAARGSLEMQDPKKSPKIRHLGTIAQLCRAISSQLRHISTIGKNFISVNTSPRRPNNMANFVPLAAEIGPVVWVTPANFNRFRVLAALLHGTTVVGVSQTCSVKQRALPLFGRTAIMLGIDPNSGFVLFSACLLLICFLPCHCRTLITFQYRSRTRAF